MNLEDMVREWVDDFPMDKAIRKEAEDITSADINWKHVRFYHGETEYFNQVKKSTPRMHVLFSAHFTNDTDQPQVYTLKTERRTKSTCMITMERSYMIGFELNIKVGPPNPVIEANAGFKGEMTVKRGDEETFEEELVWSVDNQISVPAKYRTKADLVLKEDGYTGDFKVETKMAGKIHVTLRSKKDGSVLMPITADVRHIFRSNKMFTIQADGVFFESRGRCSCRFGIEQHVKLSQMALADIEPEPEVEENGDT